MSGLPCDSFDRPHLSGLSLGYRHARHPLDLGVITRRAQRVHAIDRSRELALALRHSVVAGRVERQANGLLAKSLLVHFEYQLLPATGRRGLKIRRRTTSAAKC